MRADPPVIRLGATEIEFRGNHTITHLAGGLDVVAAPQSDPEYIARAESLGYGADTLAMSRDHEVLHSMIAQFLGLPESPTLRGVADGRYWPHWHAEECAVLALQKMARAAGVDPVAVARRLADA